MNVVLLTETEKQGVHTHTVDTEESMCNEVGANHHSLVKKGNIFVTKRVTKKKP